MALVKQNPCTQGTQMVFGLLMAAANIFVLFGVVALLRQSFPEEIIAVVQTIIIIVSPWFVPGIVVGVLCLFAAFVYDPCDCCCKAETTNFKLSGWLSAFAALVALAMCVCSGIMWWQLDQWEPYKQYTCCKSGSIAAVAGYNWEKTGTTKPTCPTGSTCTDHSIKMSSKLASKTYFTTAEWTAFGIDNLKMTDYAKAGDQYFKPKPLATSKDSLTDDEKQEYTLSAQCSDSNCMSKDGSGGTDCYADGRMGGLALFQSSLEEKEEMACSGSDKVVKVNGVWNEFAKNAQNVAYAIYKVVVYGVLFPHAVMFCLALLATIFTCAEPQYMYSPPPPTFSLPAEPYMVPMEQDYVMYDAPMAYEQPYEMQYEMGYPAVQPMYPGYDQNFQMNMQEVVSDRYPYAGSHY